MKPSKNRNNKIYRAINQIISKQICAPLSKPLRKNYGRRSVRIMVDDTVKVIRGEYKGITGKVTKISTDSSGVAIEGNKKEKLKGEKIDVYIHSTNVIVTSLNTNDKWRLKILEKKPKSKIKSMKMTLKRKMWLNHQLKRKMWLNHQLKRKMWLNHQLKRKMWLNHQLKRKMWLNHQLKRKITTKRVRKSNGINSRQ